MTKKKREKTIINIIITNLAFIIENIDEKE